MGGTAAKLAGAALGVAVAGVLIGFYITGYLVGNTRPVQVRVQRTAAVELNLQTVASIGPKLAPNESWVSYLVRDGGRWRRSTVWRLPANTTVHVTLYNFDGASGLRNPFLARPQGLVGPELVDGKPIQVLNPDDASHSFAVPELGILVPIAAVPDNAKNSCDEAPCTLAMAHRTISFTFRTGKPGHYHWQCFVPCAAGFMFGFGGPMQTIGYMDGFLDVA